MERNNNLHEWRLANGMTLQELAKRTGLSYKYLYQLEKGLRKGTPNNWLKIAKELKVPAKNLFSDELKESGAEYLLLQGHTDQFISVNGHK